MIYGTEAGSQLTMVQSEILANLSIHHRNQMLSSAQYLARIVISKGELKQVLISLQELNKRENYKCNKIWISKI